MPAGYEFKLTGGMGAPATIKAEFTGPGLRPFPKSGQAPGLTLRFVPLSNRPEHDPRRVYGTPEYFADNVVQMLEAAYAAGRASITTELRSILGT